MVKDPFGSICRHRGRSRPYYPQQVEETWAASIVTDPDALPAEYVETIRRRAEERLAQRDVPAAS